MKIGSIIFLGAVTLASHSIHAETKTFVEANVIQFEDPLVDVKPIALSLGAEYAFNEYFSVAAQYGVGVQDDQNTWGSIEADFSVEYLAGVNLKVSLLPEAILKPYINLGFNKTKLTAEFNGNSLGQTEDDFGYGLGVEYDINDIFSIQLEYEQLIDTSDAEMSSANLSISYSL